MAGDRRVVSRRKPAPAHRQPVYLYGPFLRDDHPTAASNTAFDLQLHARDPRWGIRALERVQDVATRHHFVLSEVVEMPANNLSVIFTRC